MGVPVRFDLDNGEWVEVWTDNGPTDMIRIRVSGQNTVNTGVNPDDLRALIAGELRRVDDVRRPTWDHIDWHHVAESQRMGVDHG